MNWKNLSSQSLAAIDKSTPVLLPVASIEQHGPHLPVSTDSEIAEHFIGRLNSELGDKILCLPVVQVCCSEHHMDFCGSLTTSHETFIKYCCDILHSVHKHQFYNIVIFNSHGGNIASCRLIAEKHGIGNPTSKVFVLTWWEVATAELINLSESGLFGTGHACELETSLMLHIAPGLVDDSSIPMEKSFVETDYVFDGDMLHGSKATFIRSMKEISGGVGVVGDPSTASAGKGKDISKLVTKQLVDIITRTSKMNR